MRWPIIGHDSTIDQLSQAIARGSVRHAYLFAGPEGIGKASLANAFGQALLCSDPPASGFACGKCLACRKISRGVHPDVQTYSLASQSITSSQRATKNTTLTIDTVRELCATASFRPMEGRWRVIVVEDAELLQGIAQEALLKTLEEPPPFMVMILLSNDAELLLPTIRSRCQVVELRPVHRSVITQALIDSGLPGQRAEELASLAAGAPGWAFRASRDPKLVKKREQSVERALTWLQETPYGRLVTAVRMGDGFMKRRPETFSDLDTLLGVWRDALLLSAGHSDFLTFRGQRDNLAGLTQNWPLDTVHDAVRSVQACIADLEANVRPRLALEAMVLQWPIPPQNSRP